MHGGTAESRVVPLKKKSDIREWWAQMMGPGFIPGGLTGIRKGKTEKGVLSGGAVRRGARRAARRSGDRFKPPLRLKPGDLKARSILFD